MNPSTSPPSSPLSSVASRSPSPPTDYPSPPSSNVSETGSSILTRDAPSHSPDRDGPPPAKKQRIMKPKELKTDHLDLRALDETSDDSFHRIENGKLERLLEVLRLKRKIVVIAGAGISVSAGIPDFRSSTGLFSTLRSQHKLKSSGKHLFDASVYRNDSSTSSFHTMVRELSHLTQNAKPTPFHHMLATLAEEGRLMRLYSQNVDGIDTALQPLATTVPLNKKGPWPKTIQLHGGLEKMACSKCGHLSNFEGALFEGPEPPSCPECEEHDIVRVAGGLRSHGIGRLRPRMVLYNEFNPDEEAIGAVSSADLRNRPDAVIVVGTSLKIPGVRRLVKEMCSVTRGRRGGFTAWINLDPEPVGIEFKDCWDLVVRGGCDDIAHHLGLPKWDDKDCGEFRISTSKEDIAKKGFIGLDLKPLEVVKTQGIPTPGASPRQQSPTTMAVMAVMAKSKQTKLPFATKPPAGKDGQAKKKPGRKPKVQEPGNKITNTFNASKASKASISKTLKSEPAGVSLQPTETLSDVFPNLIQRSSAMGPVSPADHRTNSDPGWCKDEDFDGVDFTKNVVSSVPSTPTRDNIPYDRSETISPKGRLPSGMENLLA